MNLDSLLNDMFPGDKDSNLPSFAQLCEPDAKLFCLSPYKELCKTLAASPVGSDVNHILKVLRSRHFETTQSFIKEAMDAYFTHPKVISELRRGETTLYPYIRLLDDIDYELLEPVVEQNLGAPCA